MADGQDLSSYPKPGPPITSPLQIAGQIGAYQQQQLGISQAKLDQANQTLTYMTRAFGAAPPDASKEDYAKIGQNVVDMGLVPQNMLNIYMERLNAAPTAQAFRNEFLGAAASHQEQIQNYNGAPTSINNGAQIIPGMQSGPLSANPGAFTPSGTSLPTQLPPTTPNADPSTYQPGYVGPAAPVTARPGGLPVQRPPAAMPGPVTNPAVLGPSANFGGNVVSANVGPTTNAATGAPIASVARAPGRVVTGPPANFDVGQKMYANDQASSTAKATALKPLEEAYDLAKSISTGPGTENLNKARSYLINAGLIKADEKNPAVIYAELNKNLAQFIDKNGSRSDADLAVKESGNANAKTQVQPALQHMVQKIIGRERIEIARPQAFEGGDYQNYGKHSASFPTSQDERAYSIDKLPPDEGKQLYSEMRAKALAGNTEGIKFMKSLATAKKTGQVTGLGQ